MITCPAGHASAADDYCDTCGIAIPAGSPAASAPAPAAPADTGPTVTTSAPVASSCPSCSAPTPPNALFCEACGYDFTTGSMPRAFDPLSDPLGGPAVGTTPAAEVAAPTPPADPNPAPAPADQWVAEVWIDPDWYADQKSNDQLPSPGLPIVVPLKHTSMLIGRASRSRSISPDIDLPNDSGISRRHAQLSTDGKRWWVEDLGSSNGTYVGGSIGTLPSNPLPAGQRHEIDDDDRIYLGAWTRIVVRRAEPGEF